MKGTNHGIPFNRCNLCGADVPDGESYCERHKREALDRASRNLDEMGMEFDFDIAYWATERILEGRK